MACSWSKLSDTPETVIFVCATCARELPFVKTGYGEPHVEPDATTPAPNNPTDWLGRIEQCDLP
jgi:hypothetical protein